MKNKEEFIAPTIEIINIEDIILDEEEILGVYATDS
jgi:hypothetical protein